MRDVVERLWTLYGRPKGHDWEAFLAMCGVPVKYRNLPEWSAPGVVVGKTIFLHRELPKAEMARTAFHEVAHILLHDGDVRWWMSRPQGHITVAKFERQAEEFAELFPDWRD